MAGQDDSDEAVPVVRYDEDEELAKQPTVLRAAAVPAASAAAPEERRPYLLVVAGASSVGRFYPIVDGMVIGRAPGVDVVLADVGVSRRHAKVSLLPDGTFFFEDQGSSNGIVVDGVPVTSQIVREGHRVGVGGVVLVPLYLEESGYELQKNLFASATEDAATRLAHRGHFARMAERECHLAGRYGVPLALALVRVGRFHSAAQTYGAKHATALVRAAAQLAHASSPPGALVARHAADELAVLLPETTLAAANQWAADLRAAAAPLTCDVAGEAVPFALTIAVAGTDEPGTQQPRTQAGGASLAALVTRAEARLGAGSTVAP